MDTTLHALASIPTQPQRRTRSTAWGIPGMTPRFQADIEQHEMQICHDAGLYRHLRFCHQPVPYAEPTTIMNYFEIFSAPHSLAISGDMGTYVFSRLEDMFLFFDAPAGRINPDYWSQKVTAQDVHCPVRAYSQVKFKEIVLQDYEDRKYMLDPYEQDMLLHKIKKNVFEDPDIYCSAGAREALRRFEFAYKAPGRTRIVFDYTAADEWDFKDFSSHFIWCLEAIVFGIARYRKVTAHV